MWPGLRAPTQARGVARLGAIPRARVRHHAIHALSCEACKGEPFCADVVTPLRSVILEDPNPGVRFEAPRALVRRIDREAGAVAVEDVVSRGDRECLAAAARARPRSVPAGLRVRALEALATL